MDENRAAILNNSNRIISKLQLLSVFFGDEIIYKIYLRSQVIHQLFENNAELDINKLELFHLQFTQTLVDLLRQIKKNNEKSISLLLDEIQLNRDLINKIQAGLYTQQDFKLEQQRQALKVNNSLRKLYQVLSDDSAEYPFSKNINAFSVRFAPDFYYEVPPQLMTDLLQYNATETYKNAYATIHRKLLGQLCKYDFRTSFFCGLRAGDLAVEVYKFNETERYYLYVPARNLFLFCDMTQISHVDWTTELSRKEKFVQELTAKNDQLQNSINIVKSTIPAEIKSLLVENYNKLNDMNFLKQISDVDVQANMLKAMLNTNML
ncbi:hypothetical protein HH214_11515 [Mucilaginibacter robiniae]|uniref:Uncharacterized protein n=1 Tax=Mucilaginibacter robiniae TaxID=2728022 RepID=A0A7L5DZP3_9SPHI|nr:hypothetical protein [Mucilaginibacter robiniae]QJD96455.1 hypothetical protein HH214_11515 [Mucilaginibacter robiniae]